MNVPAPGDRRRRAARDERPLALSPADQQSERAGDSRQRIAERMRRVQTGQLLVEAAGWAQHHRAGLPGDVPRTVLIPDFFDRPDRPEPAAENRGQWYRQGSGEGVVDADRDHPRLLYSQ